MRIYKPRIALLISILLLSIYGCQEVPDCAQESSYTQLKIELFDYDTIRSITVKFDSVKVIGLDSILYDSLDLLSNYSLGVNSSSTSTTFLFYSSLTVDSLSVSYDKSVKIPFEECGPSLDIFDLKIIKSTFDSSALINNFLNQDIAENIEIFL